MGLMEIELARLEYRERLADTARRNARDGSAAEHRRTVERTAERSLERSQERTREAKIDSPVLSIRLGGFRYRLWFTRNVAV